MRQLFHLLVLLSVSFLPAIVFPQTPTLLDPRTQPQFVNSLPIPGILDGRAGATFEISISQFRQDLGLKDPATGASLMTMVWGYNGSYPGPTILAQKNNAINVFWRNNLVDGEGKPLPHLLPVDESLHWAMEEVEDWEDYGVPIVTHIHGGLTESASDGLPDSWYTPGYTKKGHYFLKGDVEPYHYTNQQDAATIWYHDHALGITRLNVYAGLAGFYVITDDNEKALQDAGHLPKGPYDIGLAIQDRMFYSNGELYYPTMFEGEGEFEGPSHMPEFFGDFILVNGAAWPVLDVEPRQYRFRILNGSDSRFYNLFLSSGQQFIQIGTDNGLLPAPVPSGRLLIGTGERMDVVLDFSDPALRGQTIIMQNNAHTPFPKGSAVNPRTSGRIMAFRVSKPLVVNEEYPLTTLPATLRPPITPLTTTEEPRQLLLFEGTDEEGRLQALLGTIGDEDDEEGEYGPMGWMDPITENPALNSTEVWEIYNTTPDAHTIHLHMVHMQLLSRQRFMVRGGTEDGEIKASDIRLMGNPKVPGPEEQGWKDTYIMYPGEVTRIIATFGIPGLSVWHCHILSHEDHEMMRPYFIGEMTNAEVHNGHPVTRVAEATPELEKQMQLRMLPNPFNTELKIQLQLPQKSALSVSVYDAAGRRIRQVFSGWRDAGLQQFSVDGSRWSNGTYFCEIVVDNHRMVRKLTLHK